MVASRASAATLVHGTSRSSLRNIRLAYAHPLKRLVLADWLANTRPSPCSSGASAGHTRSATTHSESFRTSLLSQTGQQRETFRALCHLPATEGVKKAASDQSSRGTPLILEHKTDESHNCDKPARR